MSCTVHVHVFHLHPSERIVEGGKYVLLLLVNEYIIDMSVYFLITVGMPRS